MKTQAVPSLLCPALLALAACSSPSPSSVGMQDGGPFDAGQDAAMEAGPEAGVEEAGAPIRTATTRPLLATSTQNLLSDPFVTSDTSLGHFVYVVLGPVGGVSYSTYLLDRSFVSQAPAGIAAPVALLGALINVSAAAESAQILAPFAGGTAPFDAQIWASAGDASGNPVAFDTGGKGLVVSLLPNDLPSKAYPLTVTGAPVVLAGRSWVKLALASPVPMPQGGWFSIAVEDTTTSFQLQAPEVTPAAAALVAGPLPPSRTAPRSDHARTAVAAYGEILRRTR